MAHIFHLPAHTLFDRHIAIPSTERCTPFPISLTPSPSTWKITQIEIKLTQEKI
ncbi:inosine 5-monophosphate dehydrogenase [Sesbania bispinosa]|nr:inosine 5-monophosphate dehydrogenase [Sesbania bispinosa]